MSKVNVLPSEIYNRIAAGEVVERPASIVKELVENSVDAGADSISIDVSCGASKIIVSDNGCGISPEDMALAFLPHATSKISSLSDLDNIATLGFRGEALASIAAVSKTTMVSRLKNEPIGYRISYDGGKKTDSGEYGCPIGTTVTVENLFDNVPARKKFLQRAQTEEAEISSLIAKLILAECDKSIRYVLNGKTVYQTSGGGMKDAFYAVYGSESLQNMTFVEKNLGEMTLKGFINKPYYTRHNKTFQTLIVNGRYVTNDEISFVVYGCYKDYLMKRQFPMYTLYLDIPYDMVDANVHPNKKEVKFADFASVKKLVASAVRDVLIEETRIPKDIYGEDTEATREPKHVISFSDTSLPNIEPPIRPTGVAGRGTTQAIRETSSRFGDLLSKISSLNVPESNDRKTDDKPQNEKTDKSERAVKQSDVAFRSPEFAPSPQQTVIENLEAEQKVIGTLFDTYVIVQRDRDVFFIDQHAAHEKIIYDKLVASYESGETVSQDMLIPYIFGVSHNDDVLLSERLNEIKKIGFGINKLSGLNYSISSVPIECSDIDLKCFTDRLLALLNSSKMSKLDFIKDAVMQAACKSAVKGEMKLSDSEIRELLSVMIKQDITLFCPHGRPIVVKLTKTELEKWFKRKV